MANSYTNEIISQFDEPNEISTEIESVVEIDRVPVRKTSDLQNDGDGTSPFVTEKIVSENFVSLNKNQAVKGRKDFSVLGIVGEETIPIYEYNEETNNYEYIIDDFDGEEQYVFVLNENGYYESTNKSISNSYSIVDVYFNMHAERDLVIEVINTAGSESSYGVIGNIDAQLSHSVDTDLDDIYKSFVNDSSETPQNIVFKNVPEGNHIISFKYINNSESSDSGSLQFKIISPVGILVDVKKEIVGYDDLSGTIDLNSNGDLTYNGIKVITEEEFSPVEQLAKGANQAKSYKTYQDFVDSFNSMEKGLWNNGQIFNIATTFVPDLWIFGQSEDKIEFVYTSDDEIYNLLENEGTFQVGYYILGAMETGKVDLSDYPTKTDLQTAIDSAIKTTLNTEV